MPTKPKPKKIKPRSDEDGHCTICGLEFYDDNGIQHECPPGFITEVKKKGKKQ